MSGKLWHDKFLVDKLGPFVGTDFLVFHFFTFLPLTLNLAYLAPLNGAGRIFPVNFNNQRCLENSNMINFWLTSWVPLWGPIFLKSYFFLLSLFHFFTRHFEFSLVCTPKWCRSDFSSKLQLTKRSEKLLHDPFLVGKLGPFMGTVFFSFFSHFFTFSPVTLNLA